MRALVLDTGDARSCVTAVRALARGGWTVGIGGSNARGLAASSRSCTWFDEVPSPETGVAAFASAVDEAARRRGYEVVLPATDAEVLALSRERDRIAAAVPYPPHDAVERAFDKVSLAQAAAKVGMRTPATTLVRAGETMPPLSPPLVVKERLHAGIPGRGGARIEALIAATGDEAAARVATIHAAGGDAVLQEVVPGRLTAHTSVTTPSGGVVVAVQQEAERVFPPETGASTRARTVPLDRDLADAAARLLRELGWFGLAQLQFLRADGDGEPPLIDFNGRFYGSLALAVGAGANLPALWAAVAMGRSVPASGEAVVGVRYQWLEGDLRVATAQRGRRLVGEALGCIRYAAGARHSTWSLTDPLPPLRLGARLLRQEATNVPRLGRKIFARAAVRRA
jgi:predicted ATP-grasp superfamily ATP-dependent carboligase